MRATLPCLNLQQARERDYEVMDPCGKGIDEYKKCFDGLYELVTGAAAKMN